MLSAGIISFLFSLLFVLLSDVSKIVQVHVVKID